MFRITLVMIFGSVVCEEFTPERKIISLEQIPDLEILANWENYELGKLLKCFSYHNFIMNNDSNSFFHFTNTKMSISLSW